MFYIKEIRAPKRDFILSHILPTAVVFLALSAATLWSWHNAQTNVVKERESIASQKIHTTELAIQQRLKIYEEILRGSTALFNASESVTNSEWRNYVSTFNLGDRYPGLRAMGYLSELNNTNVTAFTEKTRQTMPNYEVTPAGTRDRYIPVVYVEQLQGQTTPVRYGFDMATDENRKVGIDFARDSGEAALSDKVQLLPNVSGESSVGFSLFLPVYDKNSLVTNVEQRRQAIEGYVFASFNTGELLSDILDSSSDSNYGFHIFETTLDNQNLLYEDPSFDELAKEYPIANQTSTININNQVWRVKYALNDSVLPINIQRRPTNVLVGGLVFSALIAAVVFLLVLTRTRSLASKEERNLKQAKDDLLSLASHQLRTPATGVKQYIGMVLEGYSGPVKPAQKKLLAKAYESNERQLETIEEILHVARISSNELTLEKNELNLVNLVKSLVEIQRASIAEKKHSLRLSLPKKAIKVNADETYLSIAIENLLTNATKYTYERGKLNIGVRAQGNKAVISVRDNGVGIADSERHLLFQKFSRIHNDLTRQVTGTGVGLYLTKRIVELHDGKIEITSKPGQGSTFTISLPILTDVKRKPRKKVL